VIEELPERLVVGTGAYAQMRPEPETFNELRQRGVAATSFAPISISITSALRTWPITAPSDSSCRSAVEGVAPASASWRPSPSDRTRP
jgi:hypothetical protein